MKTNKIYIIIFAVALLGLFVVINRNQIFIDGDNETPPIDVNEYIKKADAAIKKGEYSDAYTFADQIIALGYEFPLQRDAGHDLNTKILTNEIAAIVEEGNAARIILCIKERARFNSYWANADEYSRKEAEIEVLKHALQLAKAVENDDMAQKLQVALDSWE